MITIDRERCINCGQCARACPLSIVRMENGVATVGRQKRCFFCMHCVAACPQKAVVVEGMTAEETYPLPPEDSLLQLIQSRRSTRHFGDKLPPKEVLAAALQHAAWAPSAKNDHSYAWTVLYGREQTDYACKLTVDHSRTQQQFSELQSMERLGQNWVTCGAPCVIVGHAPRGDLGTPMDAIIATATLELLLWKEKISSCWGGYLMRAAEDSPQMRAWLGIPAENRICSALMVGYAQGEHYANIPPRAAPSTQWIAGSMGEERTGGTVAPGPISADVGDAATTTRKEAGC